MLSVSKNWRKRGIGRLFSVHWRVHSTDLVLASTLVRNSLEVMKEHGVEEVWFAFISAVIFAYLSEL